MEEVNGSPSVHRILEELGVIEGEDEAETETKTAGSKFPGGREPVSPLRLKTSNISSGPKIKKLPPILQVPVPEKCDKISPHSRSSPLSTASTYANIASAAAGSYSPRDDEPRAVQRSTTQCLASPPDSGGLLSRRSSGGTPGRWGSPEFTEELFTTPVPSPTASSPQQDYPYEQQPGPVYAKPSAAPLIGPRASQGAFDFNQTEMYMREPLAPNSLGMSFPAATTDTETCSAGYFYDATTGGMGAGVYGWDYSTANGNALGYQDFGGMEYSSWDSGVFV